MTSEELKANILMADVVRQYGITIDRKGFCKCPFHNEKTGSMKIYKDSYFCFGCHESGDIFKFIQKMDNCDFKTAFVSLGGTYEHMADNARIVANMKRERALNEKERREKADIKFKKELSGYIEFCKRGIKEFEPLSDDWCICQNSLPILQEYWDEKYIEGKEVNEINVYRICREIRRTINSIA